MKAFTEHKLTLILDEADATFLHDALSRITVSDVMEWMGDGYTADCCMAFYKDVLRHTQELVDL